MSGLKYLMISLTAIKLASVLSMSADWLCFAFVTVDVFSAASSSSLSSYAPSRDKPSTKKIQGLI